MVSSSFENVGNIAVFIENKNHDEAYVVHLDEYLKCRIYWITSCKHRNEVGYFDSFGLQQIPVKMQNLIEKFLTFWKI